MALGLGLGGHVLYGGQALRDKRQDAASPPRAVALEESSGVSWTQ